MRQRRPRLRVSGLALSVVAIFAIFYYGANERIKVLGKIADKYSCYNSSITTRTRFCLFMTTQIFTDIFSL
jgi:hypothetical protein